MKKILVTGATGRIGSNLCKELCKKYEVRALALQDDPQINKISSLDTEIVYGNLEDYESIVKAVEGVDAVIHLAAVMGRPSGMSKQRYFNINVVGTLNMLEASVNNSVDKFLLASTDATYPVTEPLYTPVDENHPQRPNSLYGLVKVLCEKMCFEYTREYGLPTTILRYGTVLTPPEIIVKVLKNGFGVPSKLFDDVVEVKYSDGRVRKECVKDVITRDVFKILADEAERPWKVHVSDVRDVVDGTILALEKKASENEVFNLLGGAVFAFDAAVKYATELTGEDYVTIKLPAYWSFEVDITKARNMLGYRPKYDVFRIIEDSVKYLKGEDVGVIPSGYETYAKEAEYMKKLFQKIS